MVQLVDHRGEPIDMRALREERGGAVLGVRTIIPSQPSRVPTPERLASVLREAETPGHGAATRYFELAELMEEVHLHYAGTLMTRKRGVSQIPVIVEPASDSAEDVRDADLVRDWFARDEIEDELFDILDAVGKGVSATEIIWETSERQWMPVRLQYQLPQWLDFDYETGTRLQLRDTGGYTDLPPWKFIIHRAQAKSGLPIRGGLARIAAWAWMFGTYTLQDWMRFAEIYGQPIRLGRYHASASEADKRILYRAVSQIGTDAAAMLPEGMTIEFVADQATAARSEVYSGLLAYLDSKISIAVLGQTLTTQEGSSGSYALGQVHNLVRQDIEHADGRQLAATLRRDLVVPIVALNHGPRARYPMVKIERESAVDVNLMSQALERLVPLGLRVRADEVRTRLRFTAPDKDDEVLTPPAAPAPDPGSTDPPAAPPARARDAGGHDLTRALARTVDEADPLPALTARTRATLGPRIDAWAAQIRRDLDGAGSLDDVRARLDGLLAWTRSPAAPTPDVTDAAAALQPALVAAYLAGRFDVAEEARETARALATDAGACIALATASVAHTRLPFAEQIAFFRSKLDLPTRAWTDIWQEQHDKSFVVAGAAHADLVADLRGAVDQAIAEGTTLATFRKDFDSIVAKRGWSYNGGRDWRTRVIYGTNLRTSYAAGRYQQMQDVAAERPFWRYRHSDASEEPRHVHLSWDGLILRHDDPWWSTHYPPNGWGCKCYIETLAPRDLKRLGKDGPDAAPAVRNRTVTVGAKGPSPRTVTVPEGIDPGWAYAPGQSVVLPADQRVMRRAMGEAYTDLLMRVDRQVQKAGAAHGLTAAERVAAYAYTTRDGPWSGPGLNQALRAHGGPGQPPLPPHLAAYRRTLLDALARLPDQAGTFWRGIEIGAALQAQYLPGRVVTWDGFSSTSRRADGAYTGNTRFTIRGRHGKDVRAYSAHPSEDEVLFGAGMRVRVLRRIDDGETLRIEVEEVGDGRSDVG